MFLYRLKSWTAATSTGKTTKYCLVKLSFPTHLIFSLASKDAFLTHAHPKGRLDFVYECPLYKWLMNLRQKPMPKNGQAFLLSRGDYQSFRWYYKAWPLFLGNIPRGEFPPCIELRSRYASLLSDCLELLKPTPSYNLVAASNLEFSMSGF